MKEKITIATVGDILAMKDVQYAALKLKNPNIKDEYQKNASGYEQLFSEEIKKEFKKADILFGNLENPIAKGLIEKWKFDKNGRPICKKINVPKHVLYDGKAYNHNPFMVFNAHPSLALALKNLGFDIVSTANNHFANRGCNGIDATIDALRKAKLDFVGTIRSDELIDNNGDGFPDNKAYVIKEVKGIKIAFLAFTSPINHVVGGFQLRPVFLGKLLKGDKACSKQVYCIVCNNNTVEWNVIQFCEQIKKAKKEADIVCVSNHCGIWQNHNPTELQKKLSKWFLESGADVIIGHGPHVIQPIEKYITKDKRKTFIIYSLGNFLYSGGTEDTPLTNSLVGMIAFINIIKDNNKITVDNIDYTPTFSYKGKFGYVQVIKPNLSLYKKTKVIVDIVFNGTKESRIKLSKRYLSKWIGGWLAIKDDSLYERWILRRWKRGK